MHMRKMENLEEAMPADWASIFWNREQVFIYGTVSKMTGGKL